MSESKKKYKSKKKCSCCGRPEPVYRCADCDLKFCSICWLAHGKIAVAHHSQGIDQACIEFMEGGKWLRKYEHFVPKYLSRPEPNLDSDSTLDSFAVSIAK